MTDERLSPELILRNLMMALVTIAMALMYLQECLKWQMPLMPPSLKK